MTEETRRVIGLDRGDLLSWKKGGRSQKAKTLLFVAAISITMLVGLGMLSAAPLPQYGRERRPRQWNPDQQLARMTERLHLTDDQQARIKPILEEQHTRMMALRENTSMSRQDRFAQFREVRKETFEKMKPILTGKQRKELKKMEQMRHERRMHRRLN